MNDMSLKAKIRNIAKERNVSAQSVLQNYLMSRFLFRLSESEYKDKFVVKGGMLISSIIGVDRRTTMDLDVTLQKLPLTEASIEIAFNSICNIDGSDDISFFLENINPIRDEDEYGGYRVSFVAKYGKINAPMSMDVSTGDIITPGAERHIFYDLLDENMNYELWAYPIETVLAEKIETILSRGIDNTRLRDFYDVYMLYCTGYDKQLLRDAFKSTATHRNSYDKIIDYEEILDSIASSKEMASRWVSYSKLMVYASKIKYGETIDALREIIKSI